MKLVVGVAIFWFILYLILLAFANIDYTTIGYAPDLASSFTTTANTIIQWLPLLGGGTTLVMFLWCAERGDLDW